MPTTHPTHDSLTGHLDFLKEGDAYLKTVLNAGKRPEIFTPEIVFNLLSMAIEKLMMAILTHSGCLPDNHTFDQLGEAFHAVSPLDERDRDMLAELDAHNNLCSLDAFKQIIPDASTMARFTALAERFQTLAHQKMGAV